MISSWDRNNKYQWRGWIFFPKNDEDIKDKEDIIDNT